MFPELNELYRLEKKNVEKAGQILADAFYEDPVWISVMPDEENRKEKLPISFEFILTYAVKYGEVYAPSSDIEGVALWLPHDKIEITFWRMMRSGAFRKGIQMGQDIGNRIQKVFEPIDKDRKEFMKDKSYFYLQAIGVAPEYQGKGYGGKLLRSMFDRCDEEGLPIYLETETEKNVEMYKKLGFQVIKEQNIPDYDFIMWEMIRNPR
jgi:ribosomal protein S18 acetylase RimI-like enzyme